MDVSGLCLSHHISISPFGHPKSNCSCVFPENIQYHSHAVFLSQPFSTLFMSEDHHIVSLLKEKTLGTSHLLNKNPQLLSGSSLNSTADSSCSFRSRQGVPLWPFLYSQNLSSQDPPLFPLIACPHPCTLQWFKTPLPN